MSGQAVDHILPDCCDGPNHIFNYILLSTAENSSFRACISAAKIACVGFWPCYVALVQACVILESQLAAN